MTNDNQHAAAYQYNESDGSLMISELVATAWRRKWWLVCCLVVSVLLGLGYNHQKETVYQIKARLLVEEGRSSLQGNSQSRKDEGFLATQAEIVRSPVVVRRAVDSLNALGPQHEGSIQAVTILGSLKVTPLAGTNVLGVGLAAEDRHEGVRTVEAIIANYREYLREMDRTKHVESLRLLTQREKELRSELEGLEQEYYELRKESPLMDQAREEQQQMLQQLGRSMADARNRKIELEHRIAALDWSAPRELVSSQAHQTDTVASSFRDDELPALVRSTADATPGASERRGEAAAVMVAHAVAVPINDAAFAAIDGLDSIGAQLTEAHVHAEELSQWCGPKHPIRKAARLRISVSEKQLDDTIAAARIIWERQLSSLRVHEAKLMSLYHDETTKIKTLDMHLLKERQALEAIQHVQEFYDSVHGELREWQMNNQAAASGQLAVKVTVLEPPAVTAPVGLPTSALLAVCALVGLVCGCGTIAALERIGPRVGSSDAFRIARSFGLGRDAHGPATARGQFVAARCVPCLESNTGAEICYPEGRSLRAYDRRCRAVDNQKDDRNLKAIREMEFPKRRSPQRFGRT